MRKRLNSTQRVALSIAVAIAAVIVGLTLDAALWGRPDGGWFGTTPARGITSTYYIVRTVSPWAVGGLWLLLTAAATALIVWLLADPRD